MSRFDDKEVVFTASTGLYYVAAELSHRKFVVSYAMKNPKGVDIIITGADLDKFVCLQVKSMYKSRTWLMNKKAQTFVGPYQFYIFVTLFPDRTRKPSFFIVPSEVVSARLAQSQTFKKNIDLKEFSDEEGKYLERWELLEEVFQS